MDGEFRIVEGSDIDELVSVYFLFITGRYLRMAMESFASKHGFGQEVVFVTFEGDLDNDDQAELPKVLDDQHILLEQTTPMVDIDRMAYLDFKTFYQYLDRHVRTIVERNPEEADLSDLLFKVKAGLGI